MSADNGGPAFPRQHANADADKPGFVRGHEGMTLRDYFAAKAMQSLLNSGYEDGFEEDCKGLATLAYEIADAMLAEREKGGSA